ncbi:MAG: hypothetical protein U1F54_10010 [Burkholderiales bacterium]
MHRLPRILSLVLPLLLAALGSQAHGEDARVKRIAIHVEPYYAAAREPDGTPRVNVSTALDRVLASNDPVDVLRARDAIEKEPANITPMTMMVLAIRLYDVGKRDDAVFWFYAARNRFITTARVADLKAPALGNVDQAMKSFVYLAGPVINGYAFCDIENQKTIAKQALKWTIDHPYGALLNPEVPALPGDRKENFRKAFNELMDGLAKEEAWLEIMPNVESLKSQRRENGADVKYCWRN